MHTHKALNGLVIASLLLATLLTGAATRQTRALEALKALKRAEGDEWIAARGDDQDPCVDAFHAAPAAPAGGSYTWESDSDLSMGAFDFTEVVSGTGQVAHLADVVWSEPLFLQRGFNDTAGGTIVGGTTF